MSSNHDTHAGEGSAHDAHGPVVEAESSPVDTNQPTPLSAFAWPGLIALLVLILIWGPVTSLFTPNRGGYNANGQPTPTLVPPAGTGTAAPIEATLAASTPLTGNAQTVIPQPTNALTALPANVQGGGLVTLTPAVTATAALSSAPAAPPTATAAGGAVAAPPATTPAAPPTTSAPLAPTAVPPAATPATPAAALPAAPADTGVGTPKVVVLAGKSFPVTTSNTTVPDWIFRRDPAVANWISGTRINYILGISYSPANAALFAGVHPADTVRLRRTDGAVYAFAVDDVRRIAPTDVKPLAQDHPAITLLLLGDPAPDRALIQGHFVEAAGP